MDNKNYQLIYLIPIDFNEEEREAIFKSISSLIEETGGVLEQEKKMTEARLGYPIKKQIRALVISLNFFLEPQKLEDLNKKFKEEGKLLRFSIVLQKKNQLRRVRSSSKRDFDSFTKKTEKIKPFSVKTPEKKEELFSLEEQKKPEDAVVIERKKPEEKTRLKDIEKKLDEIFEE